MALIRFPGLVVLGQNHHKWCPLNIEWVWSDPWTYRKVFNIKRDVIYLFISWLKRILLLFTIYSLLYLQGKWFLCESCGFAHVVFLATHFVRVTVFKNHFKALYFLDGYRYQLMLKVSVSGSQKKKGYCAISTHNTYCLLICILLTKLLTRL